MSDNTIRDKVGEALCGTEYRYCARHIREAHRVVQALTEAGYAVVKLAEPSEIKDGCAQWNWFPFVRLGGSNNPDRIGLGANCEHVYWINSHEAHRVAAALLAAAAHAEAQS